ncbi:chemotaxis-specific protein-glutamate methyltransferase CheB [Bosea sp. 2YAB26]|uniref:chemotaxis-specific protein-glutamate methyltransferase CheB n=1 Tax=Bosea sp. 2YAB26 TaxID=3237478 RepID=UPI003F8E7850
MIRVLVVDDSPLMRRFLGRIFEAEPDFDVESARDGIEALDKIQSFRPHVVTLDIEMPNLGGLECLDRIMVEYPCPVVMVSGLTQRGAEATLRALDMGAVDFIVKPQGTISLHAEELTPLIIERVRAAAATTIRRSRRLADRLKFRAGNAQLHPQALRGRQTTLSAPAERPASSFVLVGTSTGGPPALDSVLSTLPADFGWPVLIAQHMPASFTGPLSRRLDRLCLLEVTEVTRPTVIRAGTVYIGKGDADLVISRRGDALVALPAPSDPEHRWHPSVDRLVRSALEHVPAERLVGVLMTGMGNDGAAAMADLRAAGGHTIAEAESTAVVWGMPGELVGLGGATDVVPLSAIGQRLKDISPWR